MGLVHDLIKEQEEHLEGSSKANQSKEQSETQKENQKENCIGKDPTGSQQEFNEFNDYLFKVRLLSYIKKTIAFSSIEIKRKAQAIKKKEEATLNVIDANFNEERINFLMDTEEDFTQDISGCREEESSYGEISHSREIIKAIDSLTDRQKEIIYRCVLLGEGDTQVAKKLGITKQGVNKTKLVALKKLRELLQNKQGGLHDK